MSNAEGKSGAVGGGDEQIVCGFHAVRAALHAPGEVQEVLTDARRNDKRMRQLREQLQISGVANRAVAVEELDALADGVRHQGVVARLHNSAARENASLPAILDAISHPALLLILDQVQDPHNLGACLRTADAAGVDAVLLPKDASCAVTPAVRKVASGARVPVIYAGNLARTMRELQTRGIWITGGDHAATQSLYATDFSVATAIVIGGEARGLRRLTRENCDQLARIPIAGSVESLNVSVAAGVFLFEAVRQRNGNPVILER